MIVRILSSDLPGSRCGPYRDVCVGLQRGREPDQLIPADSASATFTTEVDVIDTAAGYDFRGPHVRGKRGDRFIYITWGERPNADTFVMFRRGKLELRTIDAEVLAAAVEAGILEARVSLTDEHGRPRCASVRPPAIAWRAAPVAI